MPEKQTKYIGRCSCGSVLERPWNEDEQKRITTWKANHLKADHVLTEDRTYEVGGGQPRPAPEEVTQP